MTKYFAVINYGINWRITANRIIKVLCITQFFIMLFNLVPRDYYSLLGVVNPAATALFLSITLFFPLLALFIRHGSKVERRSALLTLFLAIVNILITSSRGALIPIIIGVFLLFLWLPASQKIYLAIRFSYFAIFILLVFSIISFDIEYISQTFLDSIAVLEVFASTDYENVRDLDRLLHMFATLEVLLRSKFNFLFGYGFRAAGQILSEPLFTLYSLYMPHLDFVAELGDENNVATFGFNVILVDYGILGALSFIFVFISIGYKLFKDNNGYYKALLLSSLFFLFLRLYGNDFSGLILFYISLLPFGVFPFMAVGGSVLTKKW